MIHFEASLAQAWKPSGKAQRDAIATSDGVPGTKIEVLTRVRRVECDDAIDACGLVHTGDDRGGNTIAMGDDSCGRMSESEDKAGDVESRCS